MPIPNQNDKLESISAKRKVYNTLKEWIVEGTLKPGEKLNEVELSSHFGISRTPIREAILMLETQGLVTIAAGKSTTVSEIDVESMEDLYLALRSIQIFTVEQAALKATPADIQLLRDLNAVFSVALQSENALECVSADYALHLKLVDIAKNKYIIIQSQVLMNHAKRIETAFFRTVAESHSAESVHDHEALIVAIERGDKEAAAEIVSQNWMKTISYFKSHKLSL